MKYAVLGDIHANLEGLETVLEDARSQGVTHYVCLGDLVGYNANPVECLELVRGMGCPVVRGNHDHYCSHDDDLSDFQPLAAEVIDWTRRQLSDEQRGYLRSLPYSQLVETFTIVHSTLDSPENWEYVFEKLQAESSFNYQTTSLCFFGHTHVPMAFEKGDTIKKGLFSKIRIKMGHRYFVNVGSVGQPRDGDPRAAYVIFDMLSNTLELRRLEYDVATAQRKVREAGLPQRCADRLAVGR